MLRPAGLDVQSWTGYQCLSGDGRYAAVVVEPTAAVTSEAARDRGAFAYSVELPSGRVRPVASGVGLKYFSPGCGTGDTAVFTVNLGSNDEATELVVASLASGRVTRSTRVAGQVTSTVPSRTGLVGVVGSTLVAVPRSGHTRVIARVGGDAYDLRPSADGGVSFLTAVPGRGTATAMHEHAGRLTKLAAGPLTRLHLFQGRRGHAVLSGSTAAGAAASAAGVRVVNGARLPHGPAASSLDGDALIGYRTGRQSQPVLLATRGGGLVRDKRAAAANAAVRAIASYTPPDVGHAAAPAPPVGHLRPRGDAAPATRTPPRGPTQPRSPTPPTSTRPTSGARSGAAGSGRGSTHTGSSGTSGATSIPAPSPRAGHGPDGRSAHRLAVAPQSGPRTAVQIAPQIVPPTDPNQSPTCAVAPLDEAKQVMQPSPGQVNWASQMIEQGLLTGSEYARPANYANMGFASYSPSDDFPPIPLKHPSGSSWNTVPAAVYEAIMAQESNYDQASWHAPEGTAGDPLMSDYYGAHYDIKSIDYGSADCGYGIGQVTDGMHKGDYALSARGQVKVAVDYQENIAAGLQILESTWNQLYDDGILANNGDPKDLENWFFAAWAYNSGIQPTGAYDQGCRPARRAPARTAPGGWAGPTTRRTRTTRPAATRTCKTPTPTPRTPPTGRMRNA